MPTSQGYIFYILQHFTAELCNFYELRMLFQAVVIYLPILKFFKISCKRGKVHIEFDMSNSKWQMSNTLEGKIISPPKKLGFLTNISYIFEEKTVIFMHNICTHIKCLIREKNVVICNQTQNCSS